MSPSNTADKAQHSQFINIKTEVTDSIINEAEMGSDSFGLNLNLEDNS